MQQLVYAHPFSPAEAFALDPPTLTAEIARLRHSVAHLVRSNADLALFLADSGRGDRELELARAENEVTIKAQEERIGLLEAALAHRVGPPAPGARSCAHEDDEGVARASQAAPQTPSSAPAAAAPAPASGAAEDDAGDGGVYL